MNVIECSAQPPCCQLKDIPKPVFRNKTLLFQKYGNINNARALSTKFESSHFELLVLNAE